MKTAPKKIQNKTINTACLYRDAVLDEASESDIRDVTDLSKDAFEKLVSSMECTDDERLMVHETLADIVRQTPRRTFPGRRLYRGA
jgi:hypothetical protein